MTKRAKTLLIVAAVIWLLCCAAVVAAVVFVRVIEVTNGSMEPTLRQGERVFVVRAVGEIERGDLVIFYFPLDTSKSYIKRVIGLPGETVEVRGGAVFIDGRLLAEPYARPGPEAASQDVPPAAVPARGYYVMGDNRDYSYDSRHWGSVQRDLIYGKIVGR